MGGRGLMNGGGGTESIQSGRYGKIHINKCVFIDMIVLAAFYPLMDSRIARRSLSPIPEIREGR
jgi:hypothetical protein